MKVLKEALQELRGFNIQTLDLLLLYAVIAVWALTGILGLARIFLR